MSGLAFVFPGQGSQAVGMGKDLADRSAAARETFAEVDDALGASLSRLSWEGPADELELTANAQPAILATSVAAWRALTEMRDVEPIMAAGHSLGEYSALVCAGGLRLADAARAVRERGRLMQEAVPVGRGAMAAVIGLEAERIDAVIREMTTAQDPIGVAGFNSPEQTTISGTARAVEKVGAALREAGAKRVLPLKVSAPFHSPLMKPVEAPLRVVLESTSMTAMRFPVVANVDATPNSDAARLVDLLIAQLTAPVRWVESVRAMSAAGSTRFVELGAGRTLSGMIRKIDRALETVGVGDAASLDAAVEKL
jgi:[acyl-carrier-protein] S-malonyltransferase